MGPRIFKVRHLLVELQLKVSPLVYQFIVSILEELIPGCLLSQHTYFLLQHIVLLSEGSFIWLGALLSNVDIFNF